MSKHTPGPWTVSTSGKSYLSDEGATFDVDGPKGTVCTTDEQDRDEALANARLISAGPELLECVATIRTLAGFEALLRTKYSPALVHDILSKLDAVLAKATGGDHE